MIIPPRVNHTNSSVKSFTNIHVRIDEATLPFKNALIIHNDSDKHILSVFEDIYFNSSLDKRQLLVSAFCNLIVNYVITFQNNKQLSFVVEEIKSKIVKNFPDCNYQLDSYLRSLPFSYDYLRKLFKTKLA